MPVDIIAVPVTTIKFVLNSAIVRFVEVPQHRNPLILSANKYIVWFFIDFPFTIIECLSIIPFVPTVRSAIISLVIQSHHFVVSHINYDEFTVLPC